MSTQTMNPIRLQESIGKTYRSRLRKTGRIPVLMEGSGDSVGVLFSNEEAEKMQTVALEAMRVIAENVRGRVSNSGMTQEEIEDFVASL